MELREAQSLFDSTFQREWERYFSEWSTYLGFQSVSTDPSYDQECTRCAEWLVSHLTKIGFTSKLLPTSQKPLVYAERKGDSAKPTVLFYGHYDVQPVDPLSSWANPPFEAVVKDNRVFARGAQDNKGQSFYVIKALEALVAAGHLDCNVKVVLEGEEESGSRGLSDSLSDYAEMFKADILMVCDTGTIDRNHGTITMGLRGLVKAEIALSGPRKDLHSGIHGGMIKNPAIELSKLIASLYGPNGEIAVEDFYSDVQEPSSQDRELASKIPFDLEAYYKQIGVPATGGEQGFSWAERRGFRPTLDVNGITSGYSGPGSKTIIPSRASAKLTARLAAGQDPQRALNRIIHHLEERAPKDMNFEVVESSIGGRAFSGSAGSSTVQRAKEVLATVTGKEVFYLWEGASIPIIPELSAAAGAEPLLVGFGLEDDNIHAPNESFEIDQFRKGFLFAALFLMSL